MTIFSPHTKYFQKVSGISLGSLWLVPPYSSFVCLLWVPGEAALSPILLTVSHTAYWVHWLILGWDTSRRWGWEKDWGVVYFFFPTWEFLLIAAVPLLNHSICSKTHDPARLGTVFIQFLSYNFMCQLDGVDGCPVSYYRVYSEMFLRRLTFNWMAEWNRLPCSLWLLHIQSGTARIKSVKKMISSTVHGLTLRLELIPAFDHSPGSSLLTWSWSF